MLMDSPRLSHKCFIIFIYVQSVGEHKAPEVNKSHISNESIVMFLGQDRWQPTHTKTSHFTINRAVRIQFYWGHYTTNELQALVKANCKSDGISLCICLTIGYISRTCRLMVFTACIHYTHAHTDPFALHFIPLNTQIRPQ